MSVTVTIPARLLGALFGALGMAILFVVLTWYFSGESPEEQYEYVGGSESDGE